MKQITYKKLTSFSFIVLMFSILFLQCRKNEDVTINEPYQPVYISGGVYGNVVNEQGNPEPNVKVSNGTNSVVTDQNGVFILKDQLLDKAGAQIKFEKTGFYTIYKTVIPIKNKMVFTKLQLVPKAITKIINSVTGDVVVTNGNAQVSIPANSIVDASGNLYNGQVQVYTYWMDPSSDQTALQMPGNLTGRDKDGKEVCLQTLGMIAVELEDLAGNPLNIATGKFAEIKLPIPSPLDAQAKTSIPLWYYNATKGGWIEEGVATRQGNFYVGQVQHFSFWNCDYSFPLVTVKGIALDANGNAMSFTTIEIEQDQTMQKGRGYTRSDGSFEGKIPANSSFKLYIYGNDCQPAFQQIINTSSIDLDLGNIFTNFTSVPVTAYLLDCNSNPLSQGYLLLEGENGEWVKYLIADANGKATGYINPCVGKKIKYKAVDLINFKESPGLTELYNNQSELVFGNIKTCVDLLNYIIVNTKFNSTSNVDVFSKSTCQLVGNGLYIFGESANADSSYISFDIPTIILDIYQQPSRFTVSGALGSYYYYCDNCALMNIQLTQFGPVGSQIKGKFTGKLKEWITNAYIIDCYGEFNVVRKQ